MPKPADASPLPDESQKAVDKVLRVNQRWIVRGLLKENAAAYVEHLRAGDPRRLYCSCELALHLVHYRKSELLRDPKPLFYAGLFALATRKEIGHFLQDHPMTRAITLLLHGDRSGLSRLPETGARLAREIAAEIAGRIAKTPAETRKEQSERTTGQGVFTPPPSLPPLGL